MFLANLPDDFFQAGFDGLHQNLPPLLRTPKHMVVASVEYVPVALVGLNHLFRYTAEYYLLSRAELLERHGPGSPAQNRNAPFIPRAEQGLSGAEFGDRETIALLLWCGIVNTQFFDHIPLRSLVAQQIIT